MRNRKFIGVVRTAGRFNRSARRATGGTWSGDAQNVVTQIKKTFSHYRGDKATCQRRAA